MKRINSIILNHPNLSKEEIDIIVSTYFKQVVRDIEGLTKPEVAVLWGTLVLKPKKVESKIKMINKILENPKSIDIEDIKEKKARLTNLLEIYNNVKEKGKTGRSPKRKI